MSAKNHNSQLDIDSLLERLLKGRQYYSSCRPVPMLEEEIHFLCDASKDIFLNQPMLLELEAPIKICGNLFGQYTNLLRHFELNGFPPTTQYLFLGNYINRGRQSLETICLLLSYKLKYPKNIFLLRGNHECRSMNRIYGFYDECKHRYNIELWKSFNDCFNCLPVAAIISGKIFCCSGGPSPELHSLEQIREIQRPTDVPEAGLLCDLLWAEPDENVKGWSESNAGISFSFGVNIVHEFLNRHSMDLICRGRKFLSNGYEFFADRRLVTIFSAPDYLGEFDITVPILSIDENLKCSFIFLYPNDSQSKKQVNENETFHVELDHGRLAKISLAQMGDDEKCVHWGDIDHDVSIKE
ncbi:unnamed protein product [Adineta ricciae]|nr:unnamed protein product [Adineta ricciae]